MCHHRSVAYSEELVLLNKHQIYGGAPKVNCYLTFSPFTFHRFLKVRWRYSLFLLSHYFLSCCPLLLCVFYTFCVPFGFKRNQYSMSNQASHCVDFWLVWMSTRHDLGAWSRVTECAQIWEKHTLLVGSGRDRVSLIYQWKMFVVYVWFYNIIII